MREAMRAKTGELHVHIGGCLTAEDLFELGRDAFEQIDWTLFVDSFEKAYGERPDPAAIYRLGLDGSGADALRPYCVYGAEEGGDFARFQAKFNFSICVFRHWWHVLSREGEVLTRIFEQHRREGVRYVEYRAMAPFGAENPEGFIDFHATMAHAIGKACGDGFTARYLISLPRWQPLESYALVRRLLAERADLREVVVGLDLCYVEEGYPPESTRSFFRQLHDDNAAQPAYPLEVAYHVGEVFFDKSLESAVRWCHEAAELGAARLGHCTALGLDPGSAVARQPAAHTSERASERVAQIDYDLRYFDALRAYGVAVDGDRLRAERSALAARPEQMHCRPYAQERLEDVRLRQSFVLDQLAERAVVVETCPTSNLRIGAVPSADVHPVQRFLQSRVPLVIGADDPGVFGCTLGSEIDWVLEYGGLGREALDARLGDPLRHRFGRRGRTQSPD